jgi:hypothetical protein
MQRFILLIILIALILMTLACTEQTGPRAWIDFPLSGSAVPVGTPVAIVAHAYAPDGVAEVMLSVNGAAYRRGAPAKPGDAFTAASLEWLPQQEGVYLLQVTAYSKNGDSMNAQSVSVRAVGKVTATPVGPTPVVITPGIVTPVTRASDLALVSVDAVVTGSKGDAQICDIRVVYRNAGSIPVPNDYVIQASLDGRPILSMTRGAGFGVGGTSEAIFPYQFMGSAYVGINLDSTDAVAENSEANNAFAEIRVCGAATPVITPVIPVTVPRPPSITIPAPATGCTGTPAIASFSAYPQSITQGQTATLSWGSVINADSVTIEPGIGGVSTPGSRGVSPVTTTTYTMTARCGSNVVTRQTTVTVLPLAQIITPTRTPTRTQTPHDTQGPPAPNLVSPKGTFSQCRTSVTLDWNAVSDPSGIKNYIVKWVRNDGQSGGTVTTSTQHTISLTCDNKSHSYTWSVQAEDNAGNKGATGSATFTNPAGLY